MRRGLMLSLLAGLALVGVVAVLLLVPAIRSLDEPVGGSAEDYVLDVPAGRSLGELTAQLAADGVLARPEVLRWYARWRELDQRIQAGEYLIDAGLTPRGLLDKFVSGDVRLYSFTIVEGWTFRELLAAIAADPVIESTLAYGMSPITFQRPPPSLNWVLALNAEPRASEMSKTSESESTGSPSEGVNVDGPTVWTVPLDSS